MKRTIFDLDNCISADGWRTHHINYALPPDERWDKYHSLCDLDPPAHVSLVKASPNPVFFTARPEYLRAETAAWISTHFEIHAPKIWMRGEKDHRPSPELKLSMLHDLLTRNDCDEVIAAYDDREDVLAMYRENDVTAVQLQIAPASIYAQQLRAPDLLDAGAATFRQRNAVYGNSYLSFGRLLKTWFPVELRLSTEEDFNRLGLFVHCADKLTRYAANIEIGGHEDSAHDLMVYAAMLQECTK